MLNGRLLFGGRPFVFNPVVFSKSLGPRPHAACREDEAARNRSNSARAKTKCRKLGILRIRPRFTSRRSVIVDKPPKYSAACGNLNAPISVKGTRTILATFLFRGLVVLMSNPLEQNQCKVNALFKIRQLPYLQILCETPAIEITFSGSASLIRCAMSCEWIGLT